MALDDESYLFISAFAQPTVSTTDSTISSPTPHRNPSSLRASIFGRPQAASATNRSAGLPVRGGSGLDRRPSPADSSDEYELADFRDITEQAQRRNTLDRTLPRPSKRRWIDDYLTMKFSHSILFNSVPDWSSHYLAYSNLKKLWVFRLDRRGRNALGPR